MKETASIAWSLGSLDSECDVQHGLTALTPQQLIPGQVVGQVSMIISGPYKATIAFYRKPSPPIAQGWPLSWVPQALKFPQTRFTELRGVDASLYVRFLKGCGVYTLVQL